MRRLNEARANGAVCGLAGGLTAAPPVRWNASLEAAALTQSEEMALLGRMGHRDRLNRGLTERLTATGYRFSSAVENVAVGYPSVDAVVDAWLKSEGHCENLMNRAALELGLACIDGGSLNDANSADEIGGRRYWTLVLGAPRRAR
ncbi:MAG: CAP domain-containing protein [Caldimonas sp.]